MARNRTSGEKQRDGSWGFTYDDSAAVRLLNSLQPAVAREVYNSFGYIADVLRPKLAAAFPEAGGSFPDTDPAYRGRATGAARRSIVSTRSGNPGSASRSSKIRVSIYPRARYAYMLGYGWRERTIKVGGGRVRSRDVRAKVARGGKISRRIVSKGQGSGYTRTHHLHAHSIAPPIVAQNKSWIDQQIVDAINRGTKEASNGRGP